MTNRLNQDSHLVLVLCIPQFLFGAICLYPSNSNNDSVRTAYIATKPSTKNLDPWYPRVVVSQKPVKRVSASRNDAGSRQDGNDL